MKKKCGVVIFAAIVIMVLIISLIHNPPALSFVICVFLAFLLIAIILLNPNRQRFHNARIAVVSVRGPL